MLRNLAFVVSFANLALAQTPANCSLFSNGYLAVRQQAADEYGLPSTYVGAIPGVNTRGLDGHSDGFLVSHYKNGTAIPPQTWEFLTCSDLDNHPLPPGYSYPTSGPANDYFGILRPAGQTQKCLSIGSKKDNSTGAVNRLVLADCTKVEERYRTFMIEDYIYGDSDDGMKLYYANADDTYLFKNTTHNELVVQTNDKKAGSAAQQLLLLTDFN